MQDSSWDLFLRWQKLKPPDDEVVIASFLGAIAASLLDSNQLEKEFGERVLRQFEEALSKKSVN